MHEKKETHYDFRTQTLVDTETELPIATVMHGSDHDDMVRAQRPGNKGRARSSLQICLSDSFSALLYGTRLLEASA